MAGTAIGLAMCTLSFVTLWDGLEQALQNADSVPRNLVATISADIARNIESTDLSLRALVSGAEDRNSIAVVNR